MKKNIKYFLITIFLGLTCYSLASCNGTTQNSESSIENTLEVTFEQSTLSLALGDTFQLKAYANGAESAATWQVQGDSVEVNENGLLSAIRVGESTVIATIDGESATCTVNIIAPKIVPMVNYNLSDDLLMKVGETYRIVPSLVLNGESEIADILNCEIENTAIAKATSSGNTCVIEGVSVGETTATLICDWKGVELYRQISISVDSTEEVILSDLTVDIYAYGEETTKTISVKKIKDKDGKAVANQTVEWASQDESIATVQDGVVVARKVGTTTITATWINPFGEEVIGYCAVNVNPFVVDVYGKQKLSIGDETVSFNLTQYLSKDVFTWKKIMEETTNTKIGFTATGNILTLDKTNLSVGENKVIRFESEEGVIVKVKVDLLTKLIRTRAELLNWIDYAPVINGNYGGYFELANNIVFEDLEETNPTLTKDYVVPNFVGTFEGNGFTIVNGFFKRGLFGNVLKGGVIRNVAAVNVKTQGTGASGGHLYGVFAHTFSGLMENVCLVYHESGLVWEQNGLVGRLENATLKNVIVHAKDSGAPGREKTYCGAYANVLLGTSISEVYVVGVPQNRIVVQQACTGWNRYDLGTTCADVGWVAGENNFGSFWDFSGEKPCFTSYKVNN